MNNTLGIIPLQQYNKQLFEEYTVNNAKPLTFITNISCLSNITAEYFTRYCKTVLSKYNQESYIWIVVCNHEHNNALQSIKTVLYTAKLMSLKFRNIFEKLQLNSPTQCIHNVLCKEWSKIPTYVQNILVISN
jgi:hypothetical protein